MKLFIQAPFSAENRSFLLDSINGCELCDNAENAEIFVGDLPHNGRFPRLKFLQICFAGAEKYCREKIVSDNVIIANVTGAFGEVISEYVIGAILSVYRKFFNYKTAQNAKIWRDFGTERTIFGETALILGCGNIGSEIAKRLKAFGANVIGIRRNPRPTDFFDEVFGVECLEEQLPKADLIISCLPETPNTIGLLGEEKIAMMKKNALFVNVGRGSVVDENALIEALKNERIFGTVLDVFAEEPLSESSPLWSLPNVFITPHISGKSFGHSPIIERKIAEICAENINLFVSGKMPNNVIYRNVGYAEKCKT